MLDLTELSQESVQWSDCGHVRPMLSRRTFVGRMSRLGAVASYLLLAAMLGACPGVTPRLQHPQVSVTRAAVRMPAASMAEAAVSVHMTLANSNATEVRARAIDWQLTVADGQPVRGRSSFDVVVPAGETRDLTVEIVVPPIPSAEISRLRESGHNRFRLSGTVHCMSARGDIGAVFDEAGAFVAER